jgi:SAM-dependent methyltransferase
MIDNIGSKFRNADAEQDDKLVRCLDFMSGLTFFRAYKSHSWRSLGITPGQVILDVACGTGSDLIHLAMEHSSTTFVGIDKSESFLRIAKTRALSQSNVSFVFGDGQRLPFADRSVAAARIDRSLQHIEAPGAVLKEMARVTRRGGRMAACEPDWGTFLLFNGNFADSMKIAELFRRSIRRPFIGRELASLLKNCGISDVKIHLHAFVTNRLEEADIIFDIRTVTEQCIAANILTRDAADKWWALSRKASQEGSFFAALNIVEATGALA